TGQGERVRALLPERTTQRCRGISPLPARVPRVPACRRALGGGEARGMKGRESPRAPLAACGAAVGPDGGRRDFRLSKSVEAEGPSAVYLCFGPGAWKCFARVSHSGRRVVK